MRHKDSLFRKYALIFGAVVGATLLISGLVSINYSYRDNRSALVRLQREKAEAAAARIAEYLSGIEQKISATSVPREGVAALEQRSIELQILRRTAAIRTLTLLDQHGKEQLRLSRGATDVLRSGVDYSASEFFSRVKSGRPYRSPVSFGNGALYMTIAMAVGPEAAGITIAEVDLEFLLDGITRIKVGDTGYAYAVDAGGRLIAHPDIGLVLKGTNLAMLPQVQAAIGHGARGDGELADARSYGGEQVLAAFGRMPQYGWFVFVEEPLSQAYRPLYAGAIRSAVLLLLGLLLTVLACVTVVRRMVNPIRALQNGAALIGQGVLDHRIEVHTGDELEELASEFNRMAERLQKVHLTLEQKVVERTRELEALNSRLAILSATDSLTEIANRRRFGEVLAGEWSRAARTGQSLTVGMLDVDWFKRYNDLYGHQAGDECLRRIARVLAVTVCRKEDLVARYGGEEFVFIAPAIDCDSALGIARKVREAIQAMAWPHEQSVFGCVTVSIGVACRVPGPAESPEILVEAADRALYRAKEQGRNSVVIA